MTSSFGERGQQHWTILQLKSCTSIHHGNWRTSATIQGNHLLVTNEWLIKGIHGEMWCVGVLGKLPMQRNVSTVWYSREALVKVGMDLFCWTDKESVIIIDYFFNSEEIDYLPNIAARTIIHKRKKHTFHAMGYWTQSAPTMQLSLLKEFLKFSKE